MLKPRNLGLGDCPELVNFFAGYGVRVLENLAAPRNFAKAYFEVTGNAALRLAPVKALHEQPAESEVVEFGRRENFLEENQKPVFAPERQEHSGQFHLRGFHLSVNESVSFHRNNVDGS